MWKTFFPSPLPYDNWLGILVTAFYSKSRAAGNPEERHIFGVKIHNVLHSLPVYTLSTCALYYFCDSWWRPNSVYNIMHRKPDPQWWVIIISDKKHEFTFKRDITWLWQVICAMLYLYLDCCAAYAHLRLLDKNTFLLYAALFSQSITKIF